MNERKENKQSFRCILRQSVQRSTSVVIQIACFHRPLLSFLIYHKPNDSLLVTINSPINMFDIFLDIDFCWSDQKEREIRRINSDIERQIKKDRREAKKQYKVLLLGTGESGKSTFIRHMRIIHGEGFGQKELEASRDIIVSNLVTCVYLVLAQMELAKVEKDQSSMALFKLTQELFTLLTPKEVGKGSKNSFKTFNISYSDRKKKCYNTSTNW